MTVSKFRVHAQAAPTELQRAAALRSSISGTLFLEVDGTYFPSQGWGDYIVPVLGWWMENAMRLLLPDQTVKNIFMDGACWFSLRRTSGSDDVLLVLYEDERNVTGEFTISYTRCLATLRGAAKSVLHELRDMGFSCEGESTVIQSRLEHIIRLEAHLKAHGLP